MLWSPERGDVSRRIFYPSSIRTLNVSPIPCILYKHSYRGNYFINVYLYINEDLSVKLKCHFLLQDFFYLMLYIFETVSTNGVILCNKNSIAKTGIILSISLTENQFVLVTRNHNHLIFC